MSRYSAGMGHGSAIAVASLKAGAVGGGLIAALVLLGFMKLGFADALSASLVAFVVAFIAGTLAVSMALLAFGVPFWHLAKERIVASNGALIVIAYSLLVSASLTIIFADVELAVFLFFAAYAVPAAYFYRSQLMLEWSLLEREA